jgi:hypothetical protein
MALCAFVLALPVLATETIDKAPKTMSMTGKVTVWDAAAKKFEVQDPSGKKQTFQWKDTTTVPAAPKVGDTVQVDYTSDEMGMAWATRIEKKDATRASN